MNEILNPTNKTYWLITDGNNYSYGETNPGQQTSIGKGWNMLYISTNQQDFINYCNSIGVSPQFDTISISARQVRLWLLNNGITLDMVTHAINNIEDPTTRDSVSIEWEYAPYIERSHPMLLPLAQSLGLTETDIDRAFLEATTI